MRERLAFLHLPKSAGTSYRHAIARYYELGDTVPWSFDRWMFGNHPGIDEVPQPILLDENEDLSGYRYMEGHYALPTIEQGFDASDVVCLFREPRSRFLSHYTFWRSWGPELRDQWLPYDVPRTARQSLLDYCNDPSAAHQSDNLIARLIIGPHPMIPPNGMIAEADRATLTELAIERLDTLGCADVLERGEDAFDALESWFGSPLERTRLNETDLDDGPSLVVSELSDPAALEALEQRTVIDRALWLHVAMRTGLAQTAARSMADVTFNDSMKRLIERTRERNGEVVGAGDRGPARWGLRAVLARVAGGLGRRRTPS